MTFIHDEHGATAIEYSLMIAFVSAGIVASLNYIGASILWGFTEANNAFPIR